MEVGVAGGRGQCQWCQEIPDRVVPDLVPGPRLYKDRPTHTVVVLRAKEKEAAAKEMSGEGGGDDAAAAFMDMGKLNTARVRVEMRRDGGARNGASFAGADKTMLHGSGGSSPRRAALGDIIHTYPS